MPDTSSGGNVSTASPIRQDDCGTRVVVDVDVGVVVDVTVVVGSVVVA